jgi:regulation of enolase protein 1 (concanavalin A-like superfamily)
LDEALDALERAIQVLAPSDEWTTLLRGRILLAQGERREAAHCFEEILGRATAAPLLMAHALAGLDAALDDSVALRSFCQLLREQHSELVVGPLTQWFLEPAVPLSLLRRRERDEFGGTLAAEWVWNDPLQDCSFTMERGVEICAANGRDLWSINWSAPRLVRPVSGDFAVETICAIATEEKPAIGGLLLWKDRHNYLRLTWGAYGMHQLVFGGCIAKEDLIIGRGRLPTERILLRLERRSSRVNALCSVDGESWFTVGHSEFPVEDPVEVGLHAIGSINRILYPGAHPEGSAIRFESFELWV